MSPALDSRSRVPARDATQAQSAAKCIQIGNFEAKTDRAHLSLSEDIDIYLRKI
jgi:hypothetical protein